MVLQSVWEEFQERCLEEGLEDCVYAGLAYDAVWAIASTLTASLSPAELHTALAGVEFDGVSVSFAADYLLTNLLSLSPSLSLPLSLSLSPSPPLSLSPSLSLSLSLSASCS